MARRSRRRLGGFGRASASTVAVGGTTSWPAAVATVNGTERKSTRGRAAKTPKSRLAEIPLGRKRALAEFLIVAQHFR